MNLEMALPSAPAAARQMRNAVAELATQAGLPEKMVDDIRLAVSEAVTNSVRYGSSAGAQIVLLAVLESDSLTITIRDEGTQAANESGPGLGLGLMIMSAVASHVQVAQVARGTVVTLTFSWGGER